MKAHPSKNVPLTKLRPATWNPNRVAPQTLKKIRRSIELFGFVENLVARPHPKEEGAYEVLSGNHRLAILEQLGEKTARVVVVELDDLQARLLAQTLNRTRGRDDPLVYRAMIEQLLQAVPVEDITSLLPETSSSLDSLLGKLGPTPQLEIPDVWGVIVDCEDEEEQNALLERFRAEGRECRELQMVSDE